MSITDTVPVVSTFIFIYLFLVAVVVGCLSPRVACAFRTSLRAKCSGLFLICGMWACSGKFKYTLLLSGALYTLGCFVCLLLFLVAVVVGGGRGGGDGACCWILK